MSEFRGIGGQRWRSTIHERPSGDRIHWGGVSDDEIRIFNRVYPECAHHDVNEARKYRFDVRWYLPVGPTLARDPDRKIRRLVLLINGLNEYREFSHYDQIGSYFAKRGIAAALVPTPYHLNRHPRWNPPQGQHGDRRISPLRRLEEKPERLFRDYCRYMDEMRNLIGHVRGKTCKRKDGDCHFYTHTFAEDADISVLGYSLGGLMGLGLTLLQSESVKSCILLNSGVCLGDIELPPEMIETMDSGWAELVDRIKTTYQKTEDRVQECAAFEHVFLADPDHGLRDRLARDEDRLRERIMLILGGGDGVIPLNKIARIEPDDGLFVMKIPGLDHILTADPRWNNWFQLALQTVIGFDHPESGTDRWTATEVVKELADAERRHGIIQHDTKNPSQDHIDLGGVPASERAHLQEMLERALSLHQSESDVVLQIEDYNRATRIDEILNELAEIIASGAGAAALLKDVRESAKLDKIDLALVEDAATKNEIRSRLQDLEPDYKNDRRLARMLKKRVSVQEAATI